MVSTGSGLINFKKEIYETEDPLKIEALRGAIGVICEEDNELSIEQMKDQLRAAGVSLQGRSNDKSIITAYNEFKAGQ